MVVGVVYIISFLFVYNAGINNWIYAISVSQNE